MRGSTVEEGYFYRMMGGLHKPNILATIRQLGMVIDVQLADQQSDLERARREKIRKYANNPDINCGITTTHGSNQHPPSSGSSLMERTSVQNISGISPEAGSCQWTGPSCYPLSVSL